MVCIDTTVLIDEFRARGASGAPVNRALLERGAEVLIVPVAAAGEFLDGAAMVSERRFQEALALLRQRRVVAADLETPVSAYLKVARGRYSFLLESVEGGERLARYSFIGTEPYRVLRTGSNAVANEVGSPPARGTTYSLPSRPPYRT